MKYPLPPDILPRLDRDRQRAGTPSATGTLIREYSPGGEECCIVYSQESEAEIEGVIRAEIALADAHPYTLEWKTYSHDTPANLQECLVTCGFAPEPQESVMVLPVSDRVWDAFAAPAYDIRCVQTGAGLDDYAAVCRGAGRANAEAQKQRLARTLQETPDAMSVYVAYIAGEPVACGRIYFPAAREFAGFAGGTTHPAHRNRGLYTALVAARLREANQKGYRLLLVDALPTSEPILSKRGFQTVTHTRPFVYRPRPR